MIKGLGLYILCTWTPAAAIFVWTYCLLQRRLAGDLPWPVPQPLLFLNLPLFFLNAGLFAPGVAAYLGTRASPPSGWSHRSRARRCVSVMLKSLIGEAASGLIFCSAIIFYILCGVIAFHVPSNDDGAGFVILGTGITLAASLLTGTVSCIVGSVMGMVVSGRLGRAAETRPAACRKGWRERFFSPVEILSGFILVNVAGVVCMLYKGAVPPPSFAEASTDSAGPTIGAVLLWLVLVGNIWACISALLVLYAEGVAALRNRLVLIPLLALTILGAWCVYRLDISCWLII
jgi:hypothetical protein